MEDLDDLAEKMVYAYENVERMREMALRGEMYAREHFSNKTITDRLLRNVNAIYDNYYNEIPIPKELIEE